MIHLHLAPAGRVKKAMDDVIPAHLRGRVTETMPAWREVPGKADLVVHAGKGEPGANVAWFASNRGAMLVCLPEAYTWLQQRISEAAAEGEDLVILDAGLVSMKVVA